jgi:hypothetical protein
MENLKKCKNGTSGLLGNYFEWGTLGKEKIRGST